MNTNLDVEALAAILHSFLKTDTSDLSRDHVFGDDPEMREIEQALNLPGKTIFVYGNHDAGKASLATALIAHLALGTAVPKEKEKYADEPAFVIDEFDEVTSEEQRERFAEFVDDIENPRLPVHFVFCGVSDSVRRLLGDHESSYGENMDVLRPNRPFEIAGVRAEGSDGKTPHRVYLVSERLFWEMFSDPTFAKSLH